MQRLLESALHGTGAAAMLLDGEESTLAAYGPVDTLYAPGSTLKPLVLQSALTAHAVTEKTTVLCRGNLTVGGHNLACTHPRDILRMDARLALSESCNTYFAVLAEQMPAPLLLQSLRSYGFFPSTSAVSPDKRALLALGVDGITVSARQLAAAYRRLAQRLAPGDAVLDGLEESVDRGMGRAAHVEGLPVALRLGGKTGTMHDRTDPLGHGWFAGVVFREGRTQEVLIVCLPGGNGADAARLAKSVLEVQFATGLETKTRTAR